MRDEIVADRPGPPAISVHADESGQGKRFLVVGSVWVLDVSQEWRLVVSLRDWKRGRGIKSEFKFSELSRANIEGAQDFIKTALGTGMLGLKACVVDTSKLKGRSIDDALYQLYYELIMHGVEHEERSGRVTLPRIVSLVKDAATSDALELPELRRKLIADCRDYWGDKVAIDSVEAADSKKSEPLQVADLFTGSVARVFNSGSAGTNRKDEFAAFFQGLAGLSFAETAAGDEKAGDAISVRHIT